MSMISRELRFSFLVLTISKLRDAKSWCGETHLQKTVFSVKTFFSDIVDYDFIMYKHGPFSFDLRDDIAGLRAARLIEVELPQEGYGPRLKTMDIADILIKKHARDLKKFEKPVLFITNWFKNNDVKELEKLSTAIFIDDRFKTLASSEKIAKMRELKPHIPVNEAERSLHLAESKRLESKSISS